MADETARRASGGVNLSTYEELLGKVAAGDELALGEIYGRLAPRVFSLLNRIVQSREAARELLIQVFLHLWKEASSLHRQRANVALWAALTARSQAVRVRREQWGLPPLAGLRSYLRSPSLAWMPPPQDAERVEERRELLAKVLRHLPKTQTEILEMAIFEGLTESEIAEKRGEPLGAARSELRAALRFLRHRLRAVMGRWTADI